MIVFVDYLHYGTIAGVVGLSALGAGIGQGLAGKAAVKAIDIQPQARADISRAALMSMALIDTASIMCLTIALLMIFTTKVDPQLVYEHLSNLGILLALAIPSCVIGIISAIPSKYAVLAIARQPFFATKINRFMLISQTVIQTPAIFGFIVALLITSLASQATHLTDSMRCIAMGSCIGLGSLGPLIGLGAFSKSACRGIGVNRNSYQKLLTLTFISNAIIETPIILSLVVVFVMFSKFIPICSFLDNTTFLASALCMGIGTLGSGISSGRTSGVACDAIAHDPSTYNELSRTSLFAQGLLDTCAIYTFLVALMIILLIK